MQKGSVSIFEKRVESVSCSSLYLRYFMSLIGLNLSVSHYFKGEECYKKLPFGGPSFIYSIYYLRGCILPELHYIWPFCSPSDSVSHCLCPVAGTQKSCWTSPFAQGWVSRDNKQTIGVESRYICPKPVTVLWRRRSLKAHIICWWTLQAGKAANLPPETTSGTAGCLLHTGTWGACVALPLISCAY